MTNTHALGSFTPPATRLIIMFFYVDTFVGLRRYLRFCGAVQPISDAKHCICQRKALHVPTQSFATAHAKHCKCQRKALQVPTQSIACANAKHCKCQRKALHVPTQSIACANAKHCMCQRKALHPPTHSFSWSFGLMTSPMFFHRVVTCYVFFVKTFW